jgi:hypothetical protein
MNPNLYSNGKPFSDGLSENLNDLLKRIEGKKASLLIVDGGVGEGKTTLAIEAVEDYQGFPVDFRKQYAMGGEDFQEKLQLCIDSELGAVIYDEAGDFNKRGALTSFNQQMNRVFETYRTFKILVVLVLPYFGVLDDSIFHKQIPRLLINCYVRKGWGNYRGYSLYRMFHLKANFKKTIVVPQAYTKTRPNFYGHFKDLDPKRSAELEKVSMEGKRAFLNESVIKNKGLMSPAEIATKAQKSKQYINLIIKKLKLKPVTQYKRLRYFDKVQQGRILSRVKK